MRLGANQKAASTGRVPLNARPLRSRNTDMYAKRNENRLRCSLCHKWGHMRHQCKRYSKCRNYDHFAHLCWEKNKGERRGVNVADLYEVEVGVPVLVGPVVDLTG